jgi:uncharacterized protein YbbK (DUF523 family)
LEFFLNKILVGVSQCLLGEPVRFDASHKRNAYLMDVLANHCAANITQAPFTNEAQIKNTV